METEGVVAGLEVASSDGGDAEQPDTESRARLEKTLGLLDKVRAIFRRWGEETQ